ncbi:hypothetical protein [Novipirellula artificiosorum]|uniref:Uncharacterized protein n=1 Tax=Novipirellula artificiosorum TaxID=2528016 RepID=A0A5C6DSC3_9BACT|nr:hypothetical protein [Novipirellula artificiosorum]TWU38391.1 hypothetical protein Poly41_28670 [Novipirellula artificiosorum]
MDTNDSKPDAIEESVAPTPESPKRATKSTSILLVPYPKFIFMYPTLIVATITAITMYLGGYGIIDPATQTLPVAMTSLFLAIMMANMFVIIFDFPRATSLTLIFVLTTAAMGLWIATIVKPDLLPFAKGLVANVRPVANTTFFVCIAVAMVLMYIAVFVSVRFNYWELRNNELLHHHGFLSDLKRYPAPNLRVDKEINDVFEFLLLGAGRLILHPSTEKRAIVLDNVLFVANKERELTRMLGSIKVQIGSDSSKSH